MSTDAQVPPADPAQAQPVQAIPAADAPAAGQPAQPPDGFVEAGRFNGLMAKHQQTLAMLRQAGINPDTGQRQQAEPVQQPAPPQGQPVPPPAPTPAQQTPDGPVSDRELLEMLLTERQFDRYTAAVDAAVAAYPNVAPLREHVRGGTAEEIMEDARQLSVKLGGDGTPAGGQPPAATPVTPAAAAPATPATPRVQGAAPSATPPAEPAGDPASELRAIFASRKPQDVKMQEYIAFKAAHPGVSLLPGGQVFSSWDRSGGGDQTGA